MAVKFGNFLIPLFLVFSIILVILWMLGRCRYKVFRRRKHSTNTVTAAAENKDELTVTLHSGIKVRLCNSIMYCCWSSSDISADIIKFYDKISVVSFETVKETTEFDECVICKDIFDNVKQICLFKCNHYFHVTCIVKWLSEKRKCPLCWSDIKRHIPASPSKPNNIESTVVTIHSVNT